MTRRIPIAPALASLLAASAAGLALMPTDAAAQEGMTFLLVPQGGAVAPGGGAQPGQEYVLILTPRTAGQQQGQAGQRQGQAMGPAFAQPGQGAGQGAPLDLERFGQELYARGYWQGRLDELQRQAQEGQQVSPMHGGGAERPGMVDLPPRHQGPGVTTFDRPGQFDIFVTPPPEGQPDRQQIQQTLREARQALQRGEAQRAEQALSRLDEMLGGGERQRLQQALQDAEQALRRNDRQAAEEALRRARQAVGGQEEQQAQRTAQAGQGGQQTSAAAQQQQPGATAVGVTNPDADADQRITAEEATAHGEQRFTEIDADRSGALSREEYTGAMTQAENPAQMFGEADLDGDGAISREEWATWRELRWAEAVAGADGLPVMDYETFDLGGAVTQQ